MPGIPKLNKTLEAQITKLVIDLSMTSMITNAALTHTPLRDLGIDSLQMTTLILALESQLGIEFPENTLLPENFETIHSIVCTINSIQGFG